MVAVSIGQVAERRVDIAGRDVTLAGPETAAWVRSPVDLLRAVVALAAFLFALGVLEAAENTTSGLVLDLSSIGRGVPHFFVLSLFGLLAVFGMFVPPVVLVWVLFRRNWRLIALYLLTTITAAVTFRLLRGFIAEREPTLPQRAVDVPDWMTQDIWSPSWMAGFAAALVVSGPWMSRPWRRACWLALALVVPLRMLVGYDVPTGLVVGLAGGWFIGSVAVVVFKAPERRPTPVAVAEALGRSGIPVRTLRRAAVDARGSTPYFAEGVQGQPYFVKVLGADERSADLLFRVYRWLRLSGVGDERPFSSLRRAVEHEALVSMAAQRSGVATPPLVAPVRLSDGSMALVYERVTGRSVDQVPAEELTDTVLRGVWAEVANLRRHQIAHRDLRQANIFLAEPATPILIDFGFGEVAAEDLLLDQDVAELVISAALDVGAARSVSNAVAVVGADAVAKAAPWMQTLTIGGATRRGLKTDRRLLEEIHEEVVRCTDLERVELAQVQRVRPRAVVMAALLFAAVWFLIPQFADLPRILQQVRGAQWAWAVPALVFSLLTYVGAAMSLSAAVSRRLSVGKTTLATLAGSFVNRISPAKIGGIALNVRYLQKQGVDSSVAAASIGLSQGIGTVVHLSLLVFFGVAAGSTVSVSHFLPSGTVVFVVTAAVLTVVGVAVLIPRIRRIFRTSVKPHLSRILANLRELLASPGRLAMLVLGSAILTMSYIGALWASIQAFGGGIPIAGIALVFLAGASLAAAAPTPGGIGAVEAALAAGLTTLGLASDVAVPAVFLYRLATFWVPVVPGWIAFVTLQRRGDI